jgi:hypothetical protein
MKIRKTQRTGFAAIAWESLSGKYVCYAILLFLALGASQGALAAEHYVLASASGSGDGSNWTNAYTCIPTDANLVRGDTYWIGPGDYRATCDGGAARTFSKAASNGLVITLRRAIASNHGAAGDWQAAYGTGLAIFHPLCFASNDWTLDGQTRTDLRTGYLLQVINQDASGVAYVSTGKAWALGIGSATLGTGGTAASNITIKYVEVVGTRNLVTPILTEVGLLTYGGTGAIGGPSSNIYIGYSAIILTGNDNADFAGTVNAVFEHNWVAYNYSTSTSHSEANAIKGNASNITLRYNVYEDMFGTAFIAFPNSVVSTPSNIYIYGNVFMRSVDNPQNVTGAIGNGIIAVLSCTNLTGLYAYNNTIVNQQAGSTGSPRMYLVSHNTSSTSACFGAGNLADVFIENNLWYSNSNVDDSSSSCAYCTGSYVWDYNAYFDTTATNDFSAHMQTGSGSPFVNYSAKDFRLAKSTKAGITLASPFTFDGQGLTRGADGIWDRGAYEFASIRPAPPSSLVLSIQ